MDWQPHEFNQAKRDICEPRWVGWEWPKSKNDPCGGCPLKQPCNVVINAGSQAYDKWIDSVNLLAEAVK